MKIGIAHHPLFCTCVNIYVREIIYVNIYLIGSTVFCVLFWFVCLLNGCHRDLTLLMNLDVEALGIRIGVSTSQWSSGR